MYSDGSIEFPLLMRTNNLCLVRNKKTLISFFNFLSRIVTFAVRHVNDRISSNIQEVLMSTHNICSGQKGKHISFALYLIIIFAVRSSTID